MWQLENKEKVLAPGVRLQSQVLRASLPIFHTTFTWNRPLAVIVQSPEGQVQRLPVHDLTRWIQISLALGVLGVFMLMRVVQRRQTA